MAARDDVVDYDPAEGQARGPGEGQAQGPAEANNRPTSPLPPPVDATPILNIVSQASGSVKIREFDGKANWRLYKTQFERVCHLNGWEARQLEYLWIHLAGDALAFAEGLPRSHELDYPQLCQAIEKRFGAERLAAVHKAELLSRKRRPHEGLAELGQHIRTLVTYAYPKFEGEALEELVLEKFLDALRSAELRKAIYQTHPGTLTDAVESGLQIEAWGLVEEKKHGRSHVRCIEMEEDENVRLLKDLHSQMKEMKAKHAEKKEITCYYCGKIGHVAKDCNLRKRDLAGQRPQKGTSAITCYRCGGRGHRVGECPSPEAENE